jgi:hypothetical protein
MIEYKIELIHEPSGAYMNFALFTEEEQDEVTLAKEIWSDMSVVVLDSIKEEE